MRNVDVFFRILERFNNLESKKVGNVIKATEIVIFKNGRGYNVYFGISSDMNYMFNNYLVKSEEEFLHDAIKNVFVPNTCVYLENVREIELDTILFIFNKKYSVTIGPFKPFLDKLQIYYFTTSPELMLNTSILISSKNVPSNLKIHLNAAKNAYFKFGIMSYFKRRREIEASEKIGYKEYAQMLETLKSINPANYLAEAYSLSYRDYLDYLRKLEVLEKEPSINERVGLISASDFLKR